MAKTQGPLVVDRSTTRRLRVDVRWGTGLEAVLALVILAGGALDRYERGEELARVAKRLPAGVMRALGRLRSPATDAWSALLGVAASFEPPHDLLTVVGRIEALDPVDLKAALLGRFRRAIDGENGLGAAVFRNAARGNKAAIAGLVKIADEGGWRDELAPIIDIPAAELANLVTTAVRDLPSQLFLEGVDAAGLLERNAAAAERLLLEADDVEVVQLLTHGVVYKSEPGIDRLLLIPSLVHRPLTLVLDHDDCKLFCYPAQLDNELSAPAAGLIGIYRALGDGTRLRIMRRLAAGTATVGRMSEELGLAKSTVHEHLLSLRAAGLVRMEIGEGFGLAPELPDLNWMLKEFLGLEMRRQCESCTKPLELDGEAYICSYECTFCPSCANDLKYICPNCAGELVQRPRRKPASTSRRRRGGMHRLEHGTRT